MRAKGKIATSGINSIVGSGFKNDYTSSCDSGFTIEPKLCADDDNTENHSNYHSDYNYNSYPSVPNDFQDEGLVTGNGSRVIGWLRRAVAMVMVQVLLTSQTLAQWYDAPRCSLVYDNDPSVFLPQGFGSSLRVVCASPKQINGSKLVSLSLYHLDHERRQHQYLATRDFQFESEVNPVELSLARFALPVASLDPGFQTFV